MGMRKEGGHLYDAGHVGPVKRRGIREKLLDLFSDEEEIDQPFYDPVHLGGILVLCMVGVGALYWLLWTLLVFEGGIFGKVSAAARVLFTSTTLKDLGYLGSPYAMGAFEGWVGNLIALLLCGVSIAALHRLYHEAARKSRRRS